MSEYLHTPLNTVFSSPWNHVTSRYDFSIKPNLPKEHTYIQVFTRQYESYLNMLKNQPNIKVLYETPYAINTYHGGTANRQKLVVWEFTDEQVPPV